MSFHEIEAHLAEEIFPGNTAEYDRLVEAVRLRNIVGFIGAGASSPLVPCWNSALNTLLQKILSKGLLQPREEKELREQIDHDPLMVADAIQDRLTPVICRDTLSSMFRLDSNSFTSLHELVVNCNFKGIITTNYDTGLENAYAKIRQEHPASANQANQFELAKWQNKSIFETNITPILHLHGIHNDPDSIVFSASDYHNYYFTKNLSGFVENMWQSERLLVIGFGFSDPYLNFFADKVLRSASVGNRHFAFIGIDDALGVTTLTRSNFVKKYRLTPIFYHIKKEIRDGIIVYDHSAVRKLIGHLNTLTSRQDGSASSPSISHPTTGSYHVNIVSSNG
jgi:hypothetical protein